MDSGRFKPGVTYKRRRFPPAAGSRSADNNVVDDPDSEVVDYAIPPLQAPDVSQDDDLISNLPNDILGTIVSLLPTKDGARTQAIACRWRSLWRSAPLNIDAVSLSTRYPPNRQGPPRPQTRSIISRILSDHRGPVRRFDCRLPSTRKTKMRYDQDVSHVESWLRSGRLGKLDELHIIFPFLRPPSGEHSKLYRMSSSVLRLTSTVVAATFGFCDFPDEMATSLSFPHLKHLTLMRVSISEDIFHGVLSACHVLETLLLGENNCVGPLHISSPTLRSIAFRNFYMRQADEMAIEDTPCLERLLFINSCVETIRVDRAPKLQILGTLSPGNSNIQIGQVVFQASIQTGLDQWISTVKILALQCSCTDWDLLLDILRFFPCLENLHVIRSKFVAAKMKNVCHYDPPDPIKCLETHLKKLALMNYKGDKQDASLAKFFVSNARVLKEVKFGVNAKIDEKWVANQHRLLGAEAKASPDAQLEFVRVSSLKVELDTHDFSIADPFNKLFRTRG